jgi:short-subunit dehydrogenase
MDTSLVGKVVVITGASSGFGKGAAQEFAKQGAHLILGARREELLHDLAEECRRSHPACRAVPVQADVSRGSDVEQLAKAAVSVFGRIDVWVNNAGVGAIGPFERIPLEDHEQVIGTNLLGTLYGSYHAYQQFLLQGRGILINVASELGRHTVPYYSSYAAAKHGVVGLSDSLRQEIDQNNYNEIHVCTVMPTAHDTPFFDHAANYSGHEVQAPPPLHDPMDVVHAIVRLAMDPKNKEVVGADGVLKLLLKQVIPGVAEKLAAKQMHKTQMVDAPVSADSPGALQEPMDAGKDLSGGRRQHDG